MSEHTPRTPLPWKPSTIIHLALKEDVEFAVCACNSHDSLLGALEKVREEAQRFGDESDNADALAGFERLESLARVAIAKVEGARK